MDTQQVIGSPNGEVLRRREPATTEAPAVQPEARPEPVRLTPALDVYESAAALVLRLDVPGVREDGVTIELDGSELRIQADQAQGAGKRPLRFERLVTVPRTVDGAQVTARLANGVLDVVLPKRDEVKPRLIPVQAG